MTFAKQKTGRVHRDDREELRVALVMTGGVSLAVWMGGVANEISRLIRHQDVYGELLDLTGSDARVDVISGTSAGGLNGALMALAIARCRGLDGLKQLWLDKAGMSELFRSPLERDPPSLMKGDEYFLPSLVDAFRQLDASRCKDEDSPVAERLTLIITTSMLKGRITRYLDYLGTEITDLDHRARFTFRRGNMEHHLPSANEAREGAQTCIHGTARAARDDFADPDIHRRLALAARCTASFPFAFEPSLCPVGETTDRPFRPDMRCHAGFQSTRFTVDGGVLVNKPIGPAVKAIYEEPAGRQVRRVLAYIVPDPGTATEPEADKAEQMPMIAKTLIDSLVTLPRNESIESELAEIQQRNAKARAQRDRRALWLEQGSLEDRAERLFDEYRRIRTEASVEKTLSALERAIARERGEVTTRYRPRLKSALMSAWIDYLPRGLPAASWAPSAESWDWGLQPVENSALAVLDVLKRGVGLVSPGSEDGDSRVGKAASTIRMTRERLHLYLDMYRSEVQAVDERGFWQKSAGAALESVERASFEGSATTEDPVEAWARGTLKESKLDRNKLVDIARNIAQLLLISAGPLRTLIEDVESDRKAPPAMREEAKILHAMMDALVPAQPPPNPSDEAAVHACLRRLLSLEVLQTVLTPHERVMEQEVELVQISAETPNALGVEVSSEDKVAGIQLGHFGAFYKRSWRANDWMWGRLDGGYRLIQVLLNPYRLRQRRLSTSIVTDVLERLALGEGESREVLQGSGSTWDRTAIEEELRFLDDPAQPLPVRLPACADAVARRLQLDIAREELRDVAGAVQYDRASGASPNAAAVTFAAEVQRVQGTGPLDPATAMYLFPRCRVGAEKFSDETRSDLFARTMGTSAAVTVSAVTGARSGVVAPLRAMLASLRGFALATWVMIKSSVEGSRAGTALVSGALATGGALVALAALVENPPSLVITVGATLLAAGFTAAAVRAGSLKASVAILVGIGIAVVPFIATQLGGWLEHRRGQWWADAGLWLRENRDSLAPIFVVVGLVAGSMLLGLMGRRRRLGSTRWRPWRGTG